MPRNTDPNAGEGANQVRGEGKIPSKHTKADSAVAADPHTDRALDSGLEETFPASDPVSILPGAY